MPVPDTEAIAGTEQYRYLSYIPINKAICPPEICFGGWQCSLQALTEIRSGASEDHSMYHYCCVQMEDCPYSW